MAALSTKQWYFIQVRRETQRLAIPLWKAQLGPFHSRPLPSMATDSDGKTYSTDSVLRILASGTGDGYEIEIWWQRADYVWALKVLGPTGRKLWRQAIQNVADRRREKLAEEAAIEAARDRGEFDAEEW